MLADLVPIIPQNRPADRAFRSIGNRADISSVTVGLYGQVIGQIHLARMLISFSSSVVIIRPVPT